MTAIPDPVEAARLRTLFAGNPVIDHAESAARATLGPDAPARHVMAALAGWEHFDTLTDVERHAVLARFVPPPAEWCAVCGGPVLYRVTEPHPGWWAHVDPPEARPGGAAHVVVPR